MVRLILCKRLHSFAVIVVLPMPLMPTNMMTSGLSCFIA